MPLNATLAKLLAEHELRSVRTDRLVFPTSGSKPSDPLTVLARARRAWKTTGLDPFTPHEARHTYASLIIAAGVNAKTLSVYMGHAAIAITLDRYGHLFPGSEQEAAAMLDAYLATAQTC